MSKAHDSHACTCPSGDGSLRWPCPLHPALLPCPFCGASARGYEIEPHQHSAALLALVPDMPKEHQGSYVIEGECQCESGLIGDNQAEVTARWNTRAPQAVAAQAAPAAVRAQLSADASRLSYVADQIRALEPVGSEGDVFLTEVIQVLKDCAALAATPALPATEDSSAGDLARHGMTPRDKATQDQIAAVMLQHGTPEQQLQALATCCSVSTDSIKAMVAAAQAEVQAEPVAVTTRAELQKLQVRGVGSPLGTMFHPDAEGFPVKLYTAPQAQPADALDAAFEAVRKRFCKLPRYSFLLDGKGNVRRVPSFTGNWVEFEAAHTLFDPVAVDAAMAAAQEGGKA